MCVCVCLCVCVCVPPQACEVLARAMKEWERRPLERNGFTNLPGDCMAFKYLRDVSTLTCDTSHCVGGARRTHTHKRTHTHTHISASALKETQTHRRTRAEQRPRAGSPSIYRVLSVCVCLCCVCVCVQALECRKFEEAEEKLGMAVETAVTDTARARVVG